MLDFLPTGGLIAIAALIFMTTIGRRLLPRRDSPDQQASPDHLSQTLSAAYRLEDHLWEAHVGSGSLLAGKTLEQSGIGHDLGLTVLALWRGRRAILNPGRQETIQAGDILLILGQAEQMEALRRQQVEIERRGEAECAARPLPLDLTEVIVPPRSGVVGKTLSELQFRQRFGLTAVALWRGGRGDRTDIGALPLEVGDALLMIGAPEKIALLSGDPDFMVLQSGHAHRPSRRHKAKWAILITGLVLGAAIVEVVPTAEAVLLGMVALALTGCISLDEAYRAIEWRVVFLLAGMLPISIALVNTGLAARLGAGIVAVASDSSPLILVAILFVLTMGVTQVVGGQVAGLIVGPVAVTVALQTGINPQAVAVAVAIACSAAFLTPVAHPVNLLMMGPGAYRASDFWRIGVPVTLIVFVFLLAGMAVFWGISA
jgi:K+/H+ antiporter YhaU regulatory subunit KhtT